MALGGPAEERLEAVLAIVAPDQHRLDPERAQPVDEPGETRLVPLAPGLRLALRETHEPHAAVGADERRDDPVDVGETLLPDGILDDHRHDVPTAVERRLPGLER